MLRWIVELGRTNACLEESMMTSYTDLPREGHLEKVYHIFGYLKKHHNSELAFDHSAPEADMNDFELLDYCGIKDHVPIIFNACP